MERQGMARANATGLRRDLELLQVLSSAEALSRGGLGVIRIAALAGREKTQVSRALSTMAEEGLVERDPESLSYRLGWRLYTMAANTSQAYLVAKATPVMRRLVGVIGETAHLCILRGDDVIVLGTEAASVHATGLTWHGIPMSPPATSPGRVLLSEWNPEEIRARYPVKVLRARAARRVFADADELLAELAIVRARGYAVVDEEFEEGVVGCSAPVRDARGDIVAALNVEAPRIRLGGRLDAVGKLTAKAAHGISSAMIGISEDGNLVRRRGSFTATPGQRG
jgi:DNA-binding IclR family transcriptional regulator